MVPCGLLGIVVLVGQLWLPELNHAWGSPLSGNVGWIRLAALLIGGYLVFIAWPTLIPHTNRQARGNADKEHS